MNENCLSFTLFETLKKSVCVVIFTAFKESPSNNFNLILGSILDYNLKTAGKIDFKKWWGDIKKNMKNNSFLYGFGFVCFDLIHMWG